MNLIRNLTPALVGLIICAVCGCTEKNEIKAPGVSQADSLESTGIRPDQQIRGASIGLFSGSIKTTDIKADYIEKYNKLDSTLAWGLDVHFFDSEGKEASHLVADSGLVREMIKWMAANGHVVVITEDDARLETEQLIWKGREEVFIVEDDIFVTIYQHGDTLTGYGLEADQELRRVKIKKPVGGVLRSTEGITE